MIKQLKFDTVDLVVKYVGSIRYEVSFFFLLIFDDTFFFFGVSRCEIYHIIVDEGSILPCNEESNMICHVFC